MKPRVPACLLLTLACVSGFSVVYHQEQGRKLFGGYRIVPKPCHSRSGQQGICMFNYECTQRNGEVVSACMDGFLFGSCCRLPEGVIFHVPDPELDIADTYRPPTDNIVQESVPPRPLPQADTVLLHQNGSVVADANNPETIFHPFDSHVGGNHGQGETILVHPGVNLSTFSPLDVSQNAPGNDSRLEAVSLVEKPMNTNFPTGSKHTTFYPLDTSKNPFPMGTTISRPSIPDATIANDIENSEVSTNEMSSIGPLYYSSRWPSNRPQFITKHTEKPSLFSSSSSRYPDNDDGMVQVPVIILDNDDKRRPPLQEPEPLPEPEPYPESHSESINHILSMLNDTNLGVINHNIQAFTSTAAPSSNPGISTWGLIDAKPPFSWKPHDTVWPSSITFPSTSSYLGSHYSNSTMPLTAQHTSYPSMTSTTYVSEPTFSTNSVDYRNKSNMTPKPAFSKPAPTVIVLPNIGSGYTTLRPISHYPTSGDNYQSMGTTDNPLTTPPMKDSSDQNTKIHMYQSVQTTKNPAILSIATKSPILNADMYGTTILIEKPTENIQSMLETLAITRKPTVQTTETTLGMGNYQNSASTYRPTVLISTTADHPQFTTSNTKRPPSFTTSENTYQSSTMTHKPTSLLSGVSISPSTLSTWAQMTNANNKPMSTNYITSTEYLSNRPTTVSQQIKPLQQLPTTLNYPHEDLVYSTSIADLVNFPPVRNPQLNMSMVSQHENPWVVQSTDDTPELPDLVLDNEISTPPFEEDDKLNIKLHSFVSKIVNSLQQNFLQLEDVVLKTGSNNSTTIRNPVSTKPSTTTKRPSRPTTSRRPITSVPISTTKKPFRLSTSARPLTSTQKPATPSRRPVTGQRPRPPVSQLTSARPTLRPPGTVATTTRRPKPSRRPTTALPGGVSTTTRKTTTRKTTTRRPSTQPAGQQQSSTRPTPTKKPTTRRPTTRRTTTTKPTSTTEETTFVTEVVTTPSTQSTSSTTARPVDYKRECGVRPLMKKNGRIVGGKGATFGAWPWQVLVKESTWLGLFTKNKCGGVLITARYIITAAHCQPGFLANLVAVLGEFDISGELESKRSVTKNVKRVIVHRHYDAATFANDLALLELDSPVSFDTHIVPICMPRDSEDFTGRMATVTGWGRLKYGGGVPSVLQEVQVPIIENSVCQEMFQTAGHSKVILSSFMCAGYANGQRDSCEGDSGGPLMMERDDGRWVLVGTVSHGIKCAAPYLPGVYMRTTYYKPWLRSITGVQ